MKSVSFQRNHFIDATSVEYEPQKNAFYFCWNRYRPYLFGFFDRQ